MRKLLYALLLSSPLSAQTPPPGVPCPTGSVLLAAKPIFGVGTKTIAAACPAFFMALSSWYASHPQATLADAVAALNGVTIQPPPVVVPPTPIPTPGAGVHYSDDFSKYDSTSQVASG